jgi:hypothetical protein
LQSENNALRQQLQYELGMLRSEYNVLMYGGKMQLLPEVSTCSTACTAAATAGCPTHSVRSG